MLLTLGELAGLTGVTTRRLDRWADRGWLRATSAGHGPGYYRRFDETEVAIAKAVARVVLAYKVDATAALFRQVRTQKERNGHGSVHHG